jgi:hypothetical protein
VHESRISLASSSSSSSPSKVQAKVHRLVCNNEDDDDDGVVADIRSRKDGGDEMNRKRCSAQLGSVDLVSYGSIRL